MVVKANNEWGQIVTDRSGRLGGLSRYMADYKERFERWQKKATEKFDEIDSQLGLKDKIEDGARAVYETSQKAAGRIKTEAEKTGVGRRAVKAAEDAVTTAADTARTAWNVSEPLRDTAAEAGVKAGDAVADAAGKAGDIIGDARDAVGSGVKRVSKMVGFGTGLASTLDAGVRSVKKAGEWAKADPLAAATTGASMAIGAGLGVVFTGISSHWLLNSAIPVWSVKKVAESFNDYLSRRETLIAQGHLTEADRERIKFERDIAKRVGAPLLGAFAFASGAVMLTNVLDPKNITGFPLGSIIGGNPVLEGVWFFANGVVCFKTSYDLFMIALDGQEDVEQMVREIRGLLPQAN